MRGRPRIICDDVRAEIIQRYKTGEKTIAIAMSTGVSHAHVCRIANAAGVSRSREPLHDPVEIEAFAKMWRHGELGKLLAEHYGRDKSTISKWRKRLGLPARRPFRKVVSGSHNGVAT